MSAINYSKWDKIDVSDDEIEGDGPKPPPVPEDGPAERHELQMDEVREKIRIEMDEALTKLDGSRKGRDDRALIAYFVAAQHRDEGATDNRERHTIIIDLLAKRQVLTAESTTTSLCAVARDAFDAKEELRGKIAIEAVNTLEACRRYNGALALFEAICVPKDDRSKAMLKSYAAHTFGELRLKRFVFEKVDSLDMRTAMDEHEAEVLKDIDPLPVARPPPKQRCGGWLPWLCLVTLVGVGARKGSAYIPQLLAMPYDDDDDLGELLSPLKRPRGETGPHDADGAFEFPDAAAAPRDQDPARAYAYTTAEYQPPANFPGVAFDANARVVVVDWDAGTSPKGDAYAKVRLDDGSVGFAPRNLLQRHDAPAAAEDVPPAFPDL